MEKLKLRIFQSGGEDMMNILKLHPDTKEFYHRVAEELGCKMDDIVYLSPINPKSPGCRVWEFFPNDKSILVQKTDIPSVYGGNTKECFVFGEIMKVKVDDITFIAETYEDSEIVVYANPATIDVLKDENL